MKVFLYSFLTLAFSALVFSPVTTVNNQRELVDNKSRIISYKERRLKHIVDSIEYQILLNNLDIQSLKNKEHDNQSGL